MVVKIYKFGGDFLDSVNDALYNDGVPVASNLFSQPTVEIQDWENVKATDKLTIAAKANAEGWKDITPGV